jgi:hypothetical protein
METALQEEQFGRSISMKNESTDAEVVIAHACRSHENDGPFETLETHLFSVTINLPGLRLTVGPYYWHGAFLSLLRQDLENFKNGTSDNVRWRLYPDDMEDTIGFFRVRGEYLNFSGRNDTSRDTLVWNFELDGPGTTRFWMFPFSFYTRTKSTLKALKRDLEMLSVELRDPSYKVVD